MEYNNENSLLAVHYKEYSYKYVIILMFFLSSVMNGVVWVITNPIPYQLEKYYSVQKSVINLTGTMF